MTTPSDKTYAIHPAIGVARMGNAPLDLANPASWYLGPEAPYAVPNDAREYKLDGKIKKQAQRFRIYEFENGRAVREVTLGEPDIRRIVWTVHLANRKAALRPGATDSPVSVPGVAPASYGVAKARNVSVEGADRDRLAIDPGPVSLDTPGASKEATGAIAFPGGAGAWVSTNVTLGTLHIEPATGRLLVFAGDGQSAGVEAGGFGQTVQIKDYANNDGWYDEIADGRVTATISFASGDSVVLDRPTEAAWVICAVPKFAPGMGYFTTLHDVATEALADAAMRDAAPSFMGDIFPILRSISRLGWVNTRGAQGHGCGKASYLQGGAMARLAETDADPASDAYKRRNYIFGRLRDPAKARDEINPKLMPALPWEVIAAPNGEDWDVAALTPLQYARMRKWRDGAFVNDFVAGEPFTALDDMPVAARPAALDLGALEGTAGTPFYPGIESWLIARDAEIYAAPLRFAAAMKPGDLTIGNALPWQADYLDCSDTWWPVQRPMNVLRRTPAEGVAEAGYALAEWAPAEWGGGGDHPDYNMMVRDWWRLGFVVSKDGGVTFAEVERAEEGLGS